MRSRWADITYRNVGSSLLALWQVEKIFDLDSKNGKLVQRLKLIANERMCKKAMFQVLQAGQKWLEVTVKHSSVAKHFYGSPQLLFVGAYPSEIKC